MSKEKQVDKKVIEKLQFPAIYFHRHEAIKDRRNSI